MARGRILIVSKHFPPLSGSTSIRVTYFIKHLAALGWKIDVVTATPPLWGKEIDPLLAEKIPDEVPVHRTYPGFSESLRWGYRKADIKWKPWSKLRASVGSALEKVPGAHLQWIPFGLSKTLQLLRQGNYALLYTIGFPFVCHEVGWLVTRFVDLPWVADFVDPWVYNPGVRYPKWKFLVVREIEEIILRQVSAVIVNTEGAKKLYLENYPFLTNDKVKVISMGYPGELFEGIQGKFPPQFRLVYTGGPPGTSQKFVPFLEALAELASAGDLQHMKVTFVGKICDSVEVVRQIKKFRLEHSIQMIKHVPQEEMITLMDNASVLILFGHKAGYQIPGKLFYYIASRKPILLIKGDDEDLSADLLANHNRGISAQPERYDIVKAIRRLYELHLAQRLDEVFSLEPIEGFSWQDLTAELDSFLRQVAQR